MAAMGQTDCSLADKMNIQTNAVIANQCGQWGYHESADGRVRMICTDTKGVGINRNLALQLAQGEILLFADDDLTYYDPTLQGVIHAFRELPEADVIFFCLDYTRDGEIFDRRRHKTKRLRTWNSLRYGAARMAIRRSALEKARLSFSPLFGGGCRYSSGEDTLLILDCLRAGLRLYSHSYVLGKCAKDSSSWFTGYNEKYFYDRGAMLACGFPRLKGVLKWHYARKLSKKADVPVRQAAAWIQQGMTGYSGLQSYAQWQSAKEGKK